LSLNGSTKRQKPIFIPINDRVEIFSVFKKSDHAFLVKKLRGEKKKKEENQGKIKKKGKVNIHVTNSNIKKRKY